MSILGGTCSKCGCDSCKTCTRTCTNPHTGTAFETVYTLYSGLVGAEIGNPTDGYLTATGDSDTSDPQDGMDGTGPWYQQVTGTFTLSPTTTRHPCRVDISFWRNNYTLGSLTPGQPAPSETLTMNRVTIENQLNSKPISLGGEVLEPGQTRTYDGIIPKVAGTGDQSLGDPRTANGTVSFLAACGNDTVTVVVKARLEWNVKQRQHVLYGTVRECYETGTPCNGTCTGGTNPPNTIYLEIKNVSLPGGATVSGLAGTYVMTRAPNFCDRWVSETDLTCDVGLFFGFKEYIVATSVSVASEGQSVRRFVTISGASQCTLLSLAWSSATPTPICGTGVIKSGTGGTVTYFVGGVPNVGTFDWEITA